MLDRENEVRMRRVHRLVTLLSLAILAGSCGGPVEPGATPAGSAALPSPGAAGSREPSAAPSPSTPSTMSPSLVARCGTVFRGLDVSSPGRPASARYEPPDGRAYFGFAFRLGEGDATLGDARPFEERICEAVIAELGGKTPTILWVWTQWLDAPGSPVRFSAVVPDIEEIHRVLGPTVVPFLPWTISLAEGGSSAPVTTKDVASGAYDGYIRQYADDVRTYGAPLVVAPVCFEMNGNWWPACSPKANPRLTRADFVAAWRRVVDIFREERATNVAWVWDPVTPLPADQDWGWDKDWKGYYPGDAYVDWIGASLFEWGQPSWLNPVYSFSVAHRKPLILTQFGVRGAYTKNTHRQNVRWLTTMLDYVGAHPAIKAILYWNFRTKVDAAPTGPGRVTLDNGQVSYMPNVNDDDCRLLAGGVDVQKLFASRIADPRYVSVIAGS